MKQSRLYIDLTDLARWQGHHTGIQRFIYQTAERFHRDEAAEFFIFDEKSNRFLEFEFSQLQQAATQPEPESVASQPSLKIRIKRKIFASGRLVYHRLPRSVRRRITPEIRQTLRNEYHRVSAKLRSYRHPVLPSAALQGNSCQFAAHDQILIMGSAWDTPTLVTELARQRHRIGFKVYHVVYDLIPVYFPHFFGPGLPEKYTKYLFEAISNGDGLLAISESTKRDTIRFERDLLLPELPITTIRLGDSPIRKSAENASVENLQPGEFVLTVGTIETRKNHQLLYQAWKLGLIQGKTLPKLVIVGRYGWLTSDLLYAIRNDPEVRGKILLVEGLDDAGLAWLYQNCAFTVYPSFYEGWGLPIAESLAYGKLCLSSNTSSMTEIAGDLIDYFSPYDIAGALEKVLTYSNQDKLAAKTKRISREYVPRTWEETYEAVKKFLLEA